MSCKFAARPAALVAAAFLLLPTSASAVVMTAITPHNASATTFQGTFDVDLYHYQQSKDAKAGTNVGSSNPATLGFSLDIGETSSISLFKLTVLEDVDKAEDATANPITVDFSFEGLASGSVTGTTSATLAPKGGNASVFVNWDGPLTLQLDDAVQLQITLGDLTINCTKGKKCDQLYAYVPATFTLVGLPVAEQAFVAETPVVQNPLPATLPLFASGLGAIGYFGWRRKRKAASKVTR